MLDAKVSKLLNEQITKELYSAYLYLDFSVCFIVKQPTRVVVHKTAFES